MSRILFLSNSPAILRAIAGVFGDALPDSACAQLPHRVYHCMDRQILSLPSPEDIDPGADWPWKMQDLPIAPRRLGAEPLLGEEVAFDRVLDVLELEDVARAIMAMEPGSQGTVSAFDVLESSPEEIEAFRMWPTSLAEADVRLALKNVLPLSAFRRQAEAARATRELDWLLHHNLTRAVFFSTLMVFPVARVLAAALMFCAKKRSPDWQVKATLHAGRFLEAFLLDEDGERWSGPGDFSESEARTMAGYSWEFSVISIEEEEVLTSPPGIFDTAALLAAVSSDGLMPLNRALGAAHALFDKGLITWPETDGRGLSATRQAQVREILMAVHGHQVDAVDALLEDPALDERVSVFVSNLEVGESEAIVPTSQRVDLTKLPEVERQIYELIVERFITALKPACEETRTIIEFRGGNVRFRGVSYSVKDPGWRGGMVNEAPALALAEGDTLKPMAMVVVPEKKILTVPLLLEAISAAGLGSAVDGIEALDALVAQELVRVEQGGELRVLDKGWEQVAVLRSLARRDKSLGLILNMNLAGALARRNAKYWQDGHRAIARRHVAKLVESVVHGIMRPSLLSKCPRCGSSLLALPEEFACLASHEGFEPRCSVRIRREFMGTRIGREQMKELLANGRSAELMTFTSKRTGKEFRAFLVLNPRTLRFTLEFPERKAVGPCPMCPGEVVEGEKGYSCSRWKDGCKFTIWKGLDGPRPDEAAMLLTRGEMYRPVPFQSGKRTYYYVLSLRAGKVEKKRVKKPA